MKLLHITATHLNLAGGIPVVLRDLVAAQNKIDGFEARVLSIKADPVEMHSDYFDQLVGSSFEEYIENYKPNVVIFHSHYYFEYIKLYKSLIRRKIPYFIEPHGSFGKAALQKSKHKKIVANQILLRPFMGHAKGYIFLNESEKEDAQFRTENDIVIPNGIDDSVTDKGLELKESWNFYFIGRFDVSHKGLDYLFDALDILEVERFPIHLKMYGKGTDEEIKYVNTRISKYQTVDVKNCGPIYAEEQAKALEQCGIMILTSRYEGFPMTVLEAWKYGNPCLVTPGTNVANEVSEHGLGWKTELNVAGIADCIEKAMEEYSNGRQIYIDKCKKYVLSNYGWDVIARRSYDQISAKIAH